MLRWLSFLLLFITSVGQAAPVWSTFERVGQGQLRFVGLKIYDIELLTPDGSYEENSPVALTIKYNRDISQSRLLRETRKQLLRQAYVEEALVEAWMAELEAIWPSVVKNDQLTFYADSVKRSQFYLNGLPLGVIEDARFAQSFLGIWLAEDTRRPSLRRKLLNK